MSGTRGVSTQTGHMVGRPHLRSATFVTMMQATDFRDLNNMLESMPLPTQLLVQIALQISLGFSGTVLLFPLTS